MNNLSIVAGTTDVSVVIRIVDSTDGTPETGVVFNTSGIDLEYRREGAASTDITEASLAALTTAHTDGGFLHIGNGYYRLDLPDAACASGVSGVLVHGTVTGMVVIGCYIQLTVASPDLIYSRLGAPAGASVSADVAAVKADTAAILVDTGTTLDARIPAALVSGRMDVSVGAMAANTLTAAAIASDAITAAKVAADVTTEIQSGLATAAALSAVDGKIDTIDTNVDSILTDTGTDGVAISASTLNSIADAVLDEALSGHTASGSLGQSLQIVRTGTAQAGAATTITLDASASTTNDFYNNALVKIVAGTGAGQGRFITDYNGSTKGATVATWAVNPDNTSVFVINAFDAIVGATAPTASEVADAVWDEARGDHVASGSFGQLALNSALRVATAQAGGASTITLDASASATDNFYRYNQINVISGTGAGQSRQISAYVGSSKVATVSLAWVTQPDNTSVFVVTPFGVDAATIAAIADGVWDEARSGHTTAGTFGEYIFADTIRLSGDAIAADNAESFFDGSGYAGTNNVIPSVTTVTGNVNGSVGSLVGHTAQSGDAFARLGAPAGASVSADVAAVKAETAAIVADTNELQTDITNGGRVDLLVDGIKAKTDSLTFTVAGEVDANVQSVNDVEIVGDGSGTPFNVA